MKRVVLVYGNPGNGKTTLANRLRDEHGFHVISIDDLYVQFIESVHPLVYLLLLGQFIAQHYQTIFSRTGPENVRGWHDHVRQTIVAASAHHDAAALKEQEIHVFQIRAEGFGYTQEAPRLTVREVAGLGLDV